MIPFNRPSFDGKELQYLQQAITNGHTAGNGPFTKQAEGMLATMHQGSATLLTSSCTHALEMAARLLDLKPGDEVIIPSYTFVSTASAFLWNGAKPVFADIRPDTLNIDPESAKSLINERTKAICIVHYAGIGAEPDHFAEIAKRHGITLIEDNAHGLGATWKGQPLGTFGAISTLSFHETKNITCGEGGAIILNDSTLVERAEILREKGTNRSRFLRRQVDKYTWVDNGSSWVMSDLLAGVLVGQLERFTQIQQSRIKIWDGYYSALVDWARLNDVEMPKVPKEAQHVGHMYYLRLRDLHARNRFIQHLHDEGVFAVFHYQPLHASPFGRINQLKVAHCPESDQAAESIVRLPIFPSMTESDQLTVVDAVTRFRSGARTCNETRATGSR